MQVICTSVSFFFIASSHNHHHHHHASPRFRLDGARASERDVLPGKSLCEDGKRGGIGAREGGGHDQGTGTSSAWEGGGRIGQRLIQLEQLERREIEAQ